ncbi:myosin-9-like [Neocloeon triangulifer]|uniref:myosin-9-like n=1 Tax=Neocloeon triangulifer TaxID=2078957 RepID=UPI00286EF299|nr:myosin-9-like [Neocloeon triangulifer]
MQRTTVLLLLLILATIQAKEEQNNKKEVDCETAKESVERSFQILSISTRQLGQKCREEKRECDKKMREFAKLEEEKKKCDESLKGLDDEVANYASSFDELGGELQKCKQELENVGVGTASPDLEDTKTELERTKGEKETLEAELATEKQEKSELQEKLDDTIREKTTLQVEVNALRENETFWENIVAKQKESKESLQVRLDAEITLKEEITKELSELKEEKIQLQKLAAENLVNYTDMQTQMEQLRKSIDRLENENKNVLTKLAICNELRSEPVVDDDTNEIDNKNMTEKCGRIGRGLELTRTNSGIYYFNHITALPWLSANDYCRARGLELASAESEDEILEVGRVRSLGYHVAFWTAASDRGHAAGQFHWPSGRKVASALWFPGQPDQVSHGREDCAYVYGSKLKDSPCSASFYFACQVPQECIPLLS